MERSINYKDRNIEYRVQGSGPVVVLVHGFGEDGSIWNKLINALEGYCFIIPELPGTGASEVIEDMSMEGLAACIEAILIKEDVQKCVLIGHSMGGYIALAYVDKYSDRLTGFGLFHSTAFADTDEKKETRRKAIEFIKEKGAFPFLKTSVPNLYAPATKEENVTLIEEHLAAVQNFSGDVLIQYYTAMINRPDRTGLLKETSLPVLFIFGKWDTAVQLEDGLKQCHLPRLSYIHILNGSGHMGMIEETEKSVRIVQDFLSATL